MKKCGHLVAFLALPVGLLALPGPLQAHDPKFTKSFRLEDCTFASTGGNPFFILEPGYQLVLEGMRNNHLFRVEITVLDETNLVAGVDTRVVEERETRDSELKEISRNYFALCTENNSVVYFGEDVDIYKNGVVVSHEGAWLAGVNGANPGVIMPGIALIGARYFNEIAPDVAMDRAEIVSISEVLETPAGTFTDVLKIKETTPLEPDAVDFKFYAPGIGLIKDSFLKLVSFSPGFVQ